MAFSESAQDRRFEVKGSLGTGGMGTVYRAHDQRLGREVAIKTLRNVTGRDLYRFKREFRSLAGLVHPNLVNLYELHTAGGEWFFTMELVEGVDFIRWVRPRPDTVRVSSGPHLGREVDSTQTIQVAMAPGRQAVVDAPLDLARLRAALPQLVEGVMALHAGGKLHRDLKPSNVLVTADGRVVLLDFGLISDVDTMQIERTHEAMAVGTPAYMSPEQAADLPLTDASDWYALGVILYEALTGWRPFEGNIDTLLRRKQLEVPRSPRELQPDVPDDLERLCMGLLLRTPDRRPTGATILANLDSLPSAAFHALARIVAARPFVGRTTELVALTSAYGAAADHAVAVFVSGESGIGKSRLVRHFLDELDDETIVIEGRCYERESVPYKALDTLIDALTAILLGLPDAQLAGVTPRDVGVLARLFPVLRRVPTIGGQALVASLPTAPHELRGRAFAALRELLAALARRKRLVITIDDLQWGDLDSALFLADLVHDDDPIPVLLLLIHRPEDDDGIVERVNSTPPGLRDGDRRAIAVGPLSDTDARELIAATHGGDRTGEAVLRDGAGHPLFLAELASTRDDGEPVSFEALIARRIAALPAAAAALVRAAAVAARPIAVDVAARAAGVALDGSEIMHLRAERLLRARRVGDDDIESVEPYHDRVRQAVVTALSPGSLRALHHGLALAYEAGGRREDVDAVVAHWLAAEQPERAARHAVSAARIAEESLAFHRAIRLYAVAIAHGKHDAETASDLHRRYADALSNVGRLVDAADEYARAAEGADLDKTLELGQLRLGQILRRGMIEESRALSRTLLAPLGIQIPATRPAALRALVVQLVRGRLRGLKATERREADVPRETLRKVDALFSASAGLGITDPIIGRLMQAHALRTALDAGEPRRIVKALALEIGYRSQKGVASRASVAVVEARVRELLGRNDDLQGEGLATTMGGFARFTSGDFGEARRYLERGLALMRTFPGMRWEITVNEQVWLAALFYLGDVRELTRQVPRLLREAIERGDAYAQDGLRAWRGNASWLFLGKPAEARANLEAVEVRMPSAEGVTIRHLNELTSRVQIELYVGDTEAAHRRATEVWPVVGNSLLLRVQVLRVEALSFYGRAMLAHRSPKAAAEGRRIAKQLHREGATWTTALAEMFDASASHLERDDRSAAAALERAELACVASGMALHADVVRLRRGQLEGGTTGEAIVTTVTKAMKAQGIALPESVAQMLLPW